MRVIWSATSPWPWTAEDKEKHFLAGMAVGGAMVLYLLTCPELNGWVWVVVAAAIVGVIKEIVDVAAGKTAEVADCLNTVAGGAAMAAGYHGIMLLLNQ
jgi:hypothetical protein